MRVTVCGAGNGGVAMSADLTFSGHAVTLFELPAFASTIDTIRREGGVTVTGSTYSGKTGTVMPHCVTTDPAEAVAEAEVVLVAVVAFGRRAFMEALAPHLRDDQVVLFYTGYWSSLIYQSLLARHDCNAVLADAELLPYFAGKTGPASSNVDAKKSQVRVAAMPGGRTKEVVDRLRELFPCFVSAGSGSPLEVNISNAAVLNHTPISTLNLGLLERLGDDPFTFYYDGSTPRICAVTEAFHDEASALGVAFGSAPRSAVETEAALYGDEGAIGSTLYEALHNWRGAAEIAFPASDALTFYKEDMTYGLVPMVRLADQVGVPVPISRALLDLACIIYGVDFWAAGLSAADLGIEGMTAEQIREYAMTGRR